MNEISRGFVIPLQDLCVGANLLDSIESRLRHGRVLFNGLGARGFARETIEKDRKCLALPVHVENYPRTWVGGRHPAGRGTLIRRNIISRYLRCCKFSMVRVHGGQGGTNGLLLNAFKKVAVLGSVGCGVSREIRCFPACCRAC